jgi:para-nitrobenzyl esterase
MAVVGTAGLWRRASAQSEQAELVEVETAYGRVRGEKNAGLATFRGIPYAGSVSGANRFKAAPPLRHWTGVCDALKFGPPSPQDG